MSNQTKADETVESLIDEALGLAIERGHSQAVIDILSVAQEYIQSGDAEGFHTPPANIPDDLLPMEYPSERFEELD